MPKPQKWESQKDYVSRAIRQIKHEQPDISNEAASGKAYGMYRHYKKKKRKLKWDTPRHEADEILSSGR